MGGNVFDGSIDEVIIYNRSLSDAEITALYNKGLYRQQGNYTSNKSDAGEEVDWQHLNISMTEPSTTNITFYTSTDNITYDLCPLDVTRTYCDIATANSQNLYYRTILQTKSAPSKVTPILTNITINFEAVEGGETSINFTIWDGTAWDPFETSSDYLEFRCTPTQTDCEPTDQDIGSSQSIFRICDNGTAAGTDVYMHVNETFANIDLKCDDDYTAAGATTLTTSNQSIHGALSEGSCIDISCWADYSNPTSGGYFDIYGYVVSS